MARGSIFSNISSWGVGRLSAAIKGVGRKMRGVKSPLADTIEEIKRTSKIKGVPLDEAAREVAKADPVVRGVKSVAESKTGKLFRKVGAPVVRWGTAPVWGPPYLLGKLAIKHPIKTAAGAGIVYGMGRSIVDRAERQTMHLNKKGIAPNHLGTDGLTLSLSRTRHGGR